MASNVNQDASARQPASKPQKLLTKAERRELQEKQRAAKAAAAGSGGAAASSTAHPKSTKSTPPASTPTAKKIPPSIAVPTPTRDRDRDRDTAGSMGDAQESGAHGKTRGIRIFSHFGIPKPVSHIVKGDVHPTIVRLALQFSSFKICGANARCIATLTAFKAVESSPLRNLCF
jgi:translation initiation factor eIF-2B subunit delta